MQENTHVWRARAACLVGLLAAFGAPGASAWELRIQGRFDGSLDPNAGVPVPGGALQGVPFKFHDQPFEWVIELNGNLVHRDIPPTGGGSPRTVIDEAVSAHAFLYLPGLPNHIGPYAPANDDHVLGIKMVGIGEPYSFQQILLCGSRSDDCSNLAHLNLRRPAPSLDAPENPLLYQGDLSWPWVRPLNLVYLGSDPSVPFVYGLNVDSLKDVTVSGFPSYSVSPIPEPSTWALIALGLVCVALAGRRHHRGEALAAVA